MPILPARGSRVDQRDNLAAMILIAWAMIRPFNVDPFYLLQQWRELRGRIEE